MSYNLIFLANLPNDRLGNFILIINVRPFSIFFGKGDFDKAECLLKNWIIALPALLFNLCLVTNTIKSLYASFGNSVRASGSGSLASSKISDSSDFSDSSSSIFSSYLIIEISDNKLLYVLFILLNDVSCAAS